jgi:hypothetical protein
MLHSRHSLFSGLLWIMFIGCVGATLATLVNPHIQQQLDDWHYGYPRTMHLVASVGHEAQPGSPTRFIALNLDRQPVVMEIPGGDIDKARILKLPYLFGADEDLTPVRITLGLINGDKLPDLVVNVKDEEVIYINDSGNYRLITDAERAGLEDAK